MFYDWKLTRVSFFILREEGYENVKIFGLTLAEISILIGLVGTFFGGVMYLFKSIVIAPLQNSIDSLQSSIQNFSNQLEESKKDRESLHQRINKLITRIIILEEHDKWEERNK